jgi:predicted aspartyl protease
MATWARSEVRFLRSFGDRVPLEMEPGAAERRHTVPFTLAGGKVIVRARVNGREWVDFTLDTGAEHTVVTVKTGERLGITPIVTTLSAGVGRVGLRGLQVGRIDVLQIGSLRVDNVRCLIKNPPLGQLAGENESFSPLALGLSMEVDYRRRQLTLARTLPGQPATFELPLRMNRLATIRGIVNGGHRGSFVIDTGGEVVSISTATARTLLQPPPPVRIKLKVYGTSGWDTEAYLLPGVQLSFDDELVRLPGPVVVLNLRAPSALLGYQIGGILGYNFLSRYIVGIDLQRSVLRLTKS